MNQYMTFLEDTPFYSPEQLFIYSGLIATCEENKDYTYCDGQDKTLLMQEKK